MSTRGLVTPIIPSFIDVDEEATLVWREDRAGMSMLSPKLVLVGVGVRVGVELEGEVEVGAVRGDAMDGLPDPCVVLWLGGEGLLCLCTGLALPLPTGELSSDLGGLNSPPFPAFTFAPAYLEALSNPNPKPSPREEYRDEDGDHGKSARGESGAEEDGDKDADARPVGVTVEGVDTTLESAELFVVPAGEATS